MRIFRPFRIYSIIVVLTSILQLGCNTNKEVNLDSNKSDVEAILGLLYQQHAAEYRALCYQSYNLAKLRVMLALKSRSKSKRPLAVISDLDETALDNSTSTAWLQLHDSAVNIANLRTWWVRGFLGLRVCSVPGSVDFFKYVDSLKIDIFYVSNRDASDSVITSTMMDMNRLGFPQTDTSTYKSHFLFLKDSLPSKESRRQLIELTHEVILLLGDNLIDLTGMFDGLKFGSIERRKKLTDSLHLEWGNRYIIFPNSVYGDWESTMYKTGGLSISAKDSIRKALLDTWSKH